VDGKGRYGFRVRSLKSDENKRKPGIDFEEAQALWDDPALLEIPARQRQAEMVAGWQDQPGRTGEKLWSAFITRRGENVRLISVRRSRAKEEAFYEGQDIGSDV
jgi:hypothetical protein